MAKQQITSEDVMNYYADMFGGHRQFEAMRLDSGNKERLVIIDLTHDFMADRDYYKITMAKMLEMKHPDLQNFEHKYKLVRKIILDEHGNEVEQPNQLPVMKLSDCPRRTVTADSAWTEYVKKWLSPNRIM